MYCDSWSIHWKYMQHKILFQCIIPIQDTKKIEICWPFTPYHHQWNSKHMLLGGLNLFFMNILMDGQMFHDFYTKNLSLKFSIDYFVVYIGYMSLYYTWSVFQNPINISLVQNLITYWWQTYSGSLFPLWKNFEIFRINYYGSIRHLFVVLFINFSANIWVITLKESIF